MITFQELVSSPIEPEHIENAIALLLKLNKFSAAYGKPLKVTSGYRSLKKHLAIYAAKGITDQSKIPMKSLHLEGKACDIVPIEDDIGHLQEWITNNIIISENIGLWYESFSATRGWVHLQTSPPRSNRRFFLP